jgi:hypothetical protein
MNTTTIHYLTQEELRELLAKVSSKRDKALTRRACDSPYCSPTPTASEPAKLASSGERMLISTG